MKDLTTFFSKLAQNEGADATGLVAQWRPVDVENITAGFRLAFEGCQKELKVPRRITLAALGNRIADGFVAAIRPHLNEFALRDCAGQGYPDKQLVRIEDGQAFAFEIKAKTSFDPGDSNRIVLTSSIGKLRRLFAQNPVCHLLATVFYCRTSVGRLRLQSLRLDFLEPSSLVDQRYEASVSHRLLFRSQHPFRLLVARKQPHKEDRNVGE